MVMNAFLVGLSFVTFLLNVMCLCCIVRRGGQVSERDIPEDKQPSKDDEYKISY